MISLSTTLAALLGAGLGVGIWLIAAGLRARPEPSAPGWWRRLSGRLARGPRERLVRGRAVLALVVGVASGVATGWVVAAIAAAALVWVAPRLLGGNREQARAVARTEAVATWTEMLRDTLSAAAGLEQAILATADLAPDAIRGEVAALASRLEDGESLSVALREFAGEVDDATCDLVVTALLLAAEQQARQLAELLGQLAVAARGQVAMRLRVEAGRARTRTSVRVIVGTTSVFAAGLVALNRDYLAPYDSISGQVVLIVVVALFASGFWWLDRMSRVSPKGRVLSTRTDTGARREGVAVS